MQRAGGIIDVQATAQCLLQGRVQQQPILLNQNCTVNINTPGHGNDVMLKQIH